MLLWLKNTSTFVNRLARWESKINEWCFRKYFTINSFVCVCLDGHKAQLQCCDNSRLDFSLSYCNWSYSDFSINFIKSKQHQLVPVLIPLTGISHFLSQKYVILKYSFCICRWKRKVTYVSIRFNNLSGPIPCNTCIIYILNIWNWGHHLSGFSIWSFKNVKHTNWGSIFHDF